MSVLFLALGIVLFMFRSVSLYSEFSIYKAPLLQPSVAAGMLKLLPEKHIKSLFTHDGIWWDSQLFPLGLTSPPPSSCGWVFYCAHLTASSVPSCTCADCECDSKLQDQKSSRSAGQRLCSLQHPAKSLAILEGPFNPNYRKDVAFLSLWPPRQGGGTEMPLWLSSLKKFGEGFPGGSAVKNLLANAGDKGLIPHSRKIPHAAEQLSLCHNYWASALEPVSRN